MPATQSVQLSNTAEPAIEACILLVDAAPGERERIEIALRRAGFSRIHTVSDSNAAAAFVQNIEPDVIVVAADQLPSLLSPSWWRGKAEIPPPVIALCNAPSDPVHLAALARGADDCVGRPLDTGELIGAVRRMTVARRCERFVEARKRDLDRLMEQQTEKHDEVVGVLKHAERKLIEVLADAEAANRGKTQLLADISHDMRTPLNAIVGYSKILMNEKLDPEVTARIENIYGAGVYLVGLVNDILKNCDTCDPIELDIELTETKLPELIQSCVPLVENQAKTAGVALVLDIAPDFPVVRTDPKRLKQVILNLVENAIKFTRPGGQVTVRASAEKSGDAYILVISDTGIGIAPEAMDLMSSVPPEKSRGDGKPAGNGLGLPITRRIVESLGGTLDFRSSPGGGTVVTLRFPSDPAKKRPTRNVSRDV